MVTTTWSAPRLALSLRVLHADENALAHALHRIAAAHRHDPDTARECALLAAASERRARELAPLLSGDEAREPDLSRLVLGDLPDLLTPAIMAALGGPGRTPRRDIGAELRELCVLVGRVEDGWDAARCGARALGDTAVLALARADAADLTRQLRWVRSRVAAALAGTRAAAIR